MILQTVTVWFNPEMLNEFAMMCFIGYLEGVKNVRIFLSYWK